MSRLRSRVFVPFLAAATAACSGDAGESTQDSIDAASGQENPATPEAGDGDGTSTGGAVSGDGDGNPGSGGVTNPASGGTSATGGGSATGATTGSGGEVFAPVDCSAIEQNEDWDLCESGDDFCTAVFNDGAGCAAVCAAAGLECAETWENPEDGTCAADTSRAQLACDPGSGHQSDFCRCAGVGEPVGGTGGDAGTGGETSTGGATGTGGESNTGGMSNTGGTVATGGSPGTGGSSSGGDLSINDPVPGFASVSGGTTGGGTNLASAVSVSTMSALQDAASGTDSAIILVQPGTYDGELDVGANKTIMGVAPGVRIYGNLKISGSDSYNVIVRNLAVQGKPCGSYDECRDGDDAVYIGSSAHHVWLDHLDISDGQDGNCDVTRSGDFVTISWTKFHYTYDKEHRFSNLIAGSDGETESQGKLRITYMNSYWGERVDSRQPRGRFGNIHMLNNYHNTGGGQIHGVGYDMALIAENCVYDEDRSIWTDMGSPRGWQGIGNIGSGDDLNDSRGTVFSIPYSYTPLPASQVVSAVTSADCGAGNTCSFDL